MQREYVTLSQIIHNYCYSLVSDVFVFHFKSQQQCYIKDYYLVFSIDPRMSELNPRLR